MNSPIPPCIVLVAPQLGENIGAAARAMCNFGLGDLRLVAPRDGWPNIAATDMAAGALERLSPVRVFDTLAQALAGCHYAYAATARRRDMAKPATDIRTALNEARARAAEKQKTALVFGPERAGLDNDDIALCHALIHIQASPDFSSINLGQAVLLAAYEWFQGAAGIGEIPPVRGGDPPAPHEKLEEFLVRLEEALDQGGFFRSEGLRPTTIRNIRSIFMRGGLSDQEVRTLHGIVSALQESKAP